MSEATATQGIPTSSVGPDVDNCRRALENFSWYLEIAREMHARHRELVEGPELPDVFQGALEGTRGSEQIVSAIVLWEKLLGNSEALPEQWRTEMKLLENPEYRGTLVVNKLLARSLRLSLVYEEDLRSRLARGLQPQCRSGEEDLSHWLSGKEAQRSLQTAIKVAAHVQTTGRYGTMAEAREALSPEEFAAYSGMIQRLCRAGDKA